jgi:uncharacterized iron-regulated protein
MPVMRLFCVLLLLIACSAAMFAQGPDQYRTPAQIQTPILKGTDPKPENATQSIIAAFDKYQVVGLGAAHGEQDLDQFILDLLRNPVLLGKINDIAVECGNSLYQPVLDRYIAGDYVPMDQVRQVWRDTTQPMCSVSAFYRELFPLIRRMNQRLTPQKRVRVLAGDPPIDWSNVKTQEQYFQFLEMRDRSIASVMEKEALSKRHKVLMLIGEAHLYHTPGAEGSPSGLAVALYEKHYPGVTMVIGSGYLSAPEKYKKYDDEFESRTASWPIPSLVQDLKGTWLADWLDQTRAPSRTPIATFVTGANGERVESAPAPPPNPATRFSEGVDAYLYLGPEELLLLEPKPAEIFLDKEYMAEVQRRATIIGGGPITDQANLQRLSDRDYQPFLVDQMKGDIEAHRQMVSVNAANLAPSKHTEIAVDPKLFDGYVGSYDLGFGVVLNITRDGDSLFVKLGNQPRFQMFPESPRDYFLKAVDAQITFVTDPQGRAKELILHQAGDHIAKRIE